MNASGIQLTSAMNGSVRIWLKNYAQHSKNLYKYGVIRKLPLNIKTDYIKENLQCVQEPFTLYVSLQCRQDCLILTWNL